MKHPTSTEKKRVEKFLEGIQWLFDIQNYERNIFFKDNEEKGDDDSLSTIAEVEINEKYRFININIFLGFWNLTPEKQRKSLLHELCHTIVHPLKELTTDALDGKFINWDSIGRENEIATTKIEQILDGLLQGRMYYARNAYKEYLDTPKKKSKR